MNNTASFNFSASWNMVRQLANQISHPSLAVVELIKNAYDADASTVLVNLENAMHNDLDRCNLIIHDDGTGMTLEDITSKWSYMGISTNVANPVSGKGRSRQGGKGLGRFGAWKLGKKVTLATKADGHPLYLLTMDFSKYPPETPLEQVKEDILVNPPAYRALFPEGKTGTYLSVEKFNESMTTATDLQRIQRGTQTLLNPFEPHEDFNIVLQLPPKFERWESFDITKITDQSLYKYEVSVDPMGQRIKGLFTDNNPYSKHHGETVEILEQTQDILGGERCVIKAVKIWIYHFSKAPGYKELWPKTNLGVLSKDDYNDKLCGFRLYKDGVRVFPYGEPGSDWLQLDNMQNKQRSVDWFSNTQIVAAARFDMTANKGKLIDKSNREGLEETVGKRQLFKILQRQVKEMRRLVNRDYPAGKPAHLEKPEFDYGRMALRVGDPFTCHPRNLGGDITKNYAITKGKLPLGLQLDSKTGVISGSPLGSSTSAITVNITSGNKQGNYTAEFTISSVEESPREPPQTQVTFRPQTQSDNQPQDDPKTPNLTFKKPPEVSNIQNLSNRLSGAQDHTTLKQLLGQLQAEVERAISELDR